MKTTIKRRYVNVIRPGVIVSTIIDESGGVETATFRRLPNGSTSVRIQRDPNSSDADIMQALACAEAVATP